jgi:hypothetical protein
MQFEILKTWMYDIEIIKILYEGVHVSTNDCKLSLYTIQRMNPWVRLVDNS